MKTIAPPNFPISMSSANPKKSSLKSKQNLRFYGPIRVLTIDARGAYCRTVWCALGLGLANILIGAVNMTILMYSAETGDIHAFLCTLAYHFFSAEAILSLNYANSWSTPMRLRHRQFTHILFQVFGICFAIAGTTIVVVTKGVSGSAHGITGFITAALVFVSAISGICALILKKKAKIVHMGFGIPAFICSIVCLVLGCLTENFKKWASLTVIVIVICCITVYSLFIILTVFMKCVSRLI